MVAGVPVPQPVVDDPEGHGLVIALAQLRQEFRVKRRISPGQGRFDGLMGFAEDLDHVRGPGLQAARAEPGDGAGAADDVLVMPISA
jgi:hypothetical protein